MVCNEDLQMIIFELDEAIKNGLGKDTNINSVVKCYISYIQDIPNGTGKQFFNYSYHDFKI